MKTTYNVSPALRSALEVAAAARSPESLRKLRALLADVASRPARPAQRSGPPLKTNQNTKN